MDETARNQVDRLTIKLRRVSDGKAFQGLLAVGLFLMGPTHIRAREAREQPIAPSDPSTIVIADTEPAPFSGSQIIVSDSEPVKNASPQDRSQKQIGKGISTSRGKRSAVTLLPRKSRTPQPISRLSQGDQNFGPKRSASQLKAVRSQTPVESPLLPVEYLESDHLKKGPSGSIELNQPMALKQQGNNQVVAAAGNSSLRIKPTLDSHLRATSRRSPSVRKGNLQTRSELVLRTPQQSKAANPRSRSNQQIRPEKSSQTRIVKTRPLPSSVVPAAHTVSSPGANMRIRVGSELPRQKGKAVPLEITPSGSAQAGSTNSQGRANPLLQEDKMLLKAHKISQSAKSESDFTEVIRLCATVLRQGIEGDKGEFAQNLSAWALNRRGQLRSNEDAQDLAMADFHRALEFDPEHWRALHNRGVTHAQSGHFAKAFDDFNRVIEINPTFAKAFSNRATLYVQAGDMQAAMEQYEESIRLDSSLLAAHIGRGRVCHQLGHFEIALNHFSVAVKLDPENALIVCSRADLLADMGRYHDAMRDYAQAIELNPQFAHAYRNGAWLLATCPDANLRDARNALIGAQRALEFGYGQRHVALDTLAAAQANAGQFDQAVMNLQQAIEIAPQSVRPAYEVRLQLYEQRQPYRTKPLAEVRQARYEQQTGMLDK